MKKIYLAALLTLALGVAGTAGAAPYQSNPYSLVYDHAITQNVKVRPDRALCKAV